jgi:hypothetical protein
MTVWAVATVLYLPNFGAAAASLHNPARTGAHRASRDILWALLLFQGQFRIRPDLSAVVSESAVAREPGRQMDDLWVRGMQFRLCWEKQTRYSGSGD